MVSNMKYDNILLSIIIPVYNVENYIDKCLNMILNQTPQSVVEVICIDDGSTDASCTYIIKKIWVLHMQKVKAYN